MRAWTDRGVTGAAAVALALAALYLLRPVAAADRLVEDVAVARLTPPDPPHPGIVVVAIGEDALAQLPYRSPIDRGLLAGLVAALRSKEVAAIGLDVLFDQPSEPAKDEALHRALAAPGAPVVVLEATRAAALTERQRAFHARFLAGLTAGHGHIARDRLDGVTRRHLPLLDGRPSLPAALAAAVGRAAVQGGAPAIDWLRPVQGEAFPVFPAEAVAVLPRAWLAGKVVLVGLVVADVDRHKTPLTVGAGTMPGLLVQANILAQLLDGRSSPVVGAAGKGAAVILSALVGAILAAALSSVGLVLAVAGGLGLLWAGAAGLAALGGPVVSPLGPSLAWAAALGIGLGRARLRERAERLMLMELFSAHLSASVAQDIWEHRDEVLRGGRPRPRALVATVMFTDVENFTPISERLGPDALMAWIEAYLEAMTEVVTAHDGIVLRFLGDGLLAAFGAPLPRRDEAAVTADARRAVAAALDMEGALYRLNREWARQELPEVRIRAGLVTGPMVGGCVGARRHLEYTVMGDVVNTAARLEALAKTVAAVSGSPCRILVARSTWERVHDTVTGRLVGTVPVKGKAEPVEVFQILGGPARPVPPPPADPPR